ncbi:hypothetical protein [Nocardia sp. NRRL S-836]|uniref:hypothetical protein n=1 Tax=Nocardia sp. NRRL S-836 TaxID=1519492 RepID=UPI0006ADF942|nr:hypothetical protein [Nocardia sp. NRRL S-836]KOV90097.1 hypothetical protein ADL03_01805 [Nocardia sp. NRRL S-836]
MAVLLSATAAASTINAAAPGGVAQAAARPVENLGRGLLARRRPEPPAQAEHHSSRQVKL